MESQDARSHSGVKACEKLLMAGRHQGQSSVWRMTPEVQKFTCGMGVVHP